MNWLLDDRILRKAQHENKNCFLLTIITHGSERHRGELHLKAKDQREGWFLEDVISRLSRVESLKGKPKIIIVQACRRGDFSTFTESSVVAAKKVSFVFMYLLFLG